MMQKVKIQSSTNGRRFPCNVVVIIDDGAVVKPIKGIDLPGRFVMELSDGRHFDCEVVDWMGDLAALKLAKREPRISTE